MNNTAEILEAIDRAKDETIKAGKANTQQIKSLLKQQHAEIIAELARIKTPIRITVVAAGRTIHFPNLGEPTMPVYSLPRDHADEPFTLDPVSVTDSEGDVAFTETFESDNPDVVSVDLGASTAHFGTFGTAILRRKVTVEGNELTVGEPSTFNLSPGALTITGGGVSFPGLTPDA